MQLTKFLDSLLPSFSRARMLEDLGATKGELQEFTLPALKQFSEAFGKMKFTNEWVQGFDEAFKKNVRFKYSGNFIAGMYEVMDRVSSNLDIVEHLIAKNFSNDITREAISILQINVIQYMESVAFCTQYSRRVMIAAVSLEVDSLNKEGVGYNPVPTKGETQYLYDHRDAFFNALSSLSGEKKEVEAEFDKIPQVMVNTGSVGHTTSLMSPSEVDPFRFNMIPLCIHPVYHFRMMVANWQLARYKAAKEERTMLEYKLLRLKLAQEGKTDAKLEGMITHTQGRIDDLNYSLMEMEKAHGIS